MSNFEAESWSWYGICWCVVIARWMSRWYARGSMSKLQVDDYLMLLVMIFDTGVIVSTNIVAVTSNNQFDQDGSVDLSQDMIDEMIWGSKWTVVSEQMQIGTTWLIKACMLIFYYRITTDFTKSWFIKAVAIYVSVGFVVMEVLYFGVWCRPFHGYWAVPQPDVQCSDTTNHLITNCIINISSDLMIFAIPMPMLWYALLPLKKKLILASVFALGTLTIISAILNKYYSFTDPYSTNWIYWYVRESSTAIIVANLPFTWGLLRRIFHLGSFQGDTETDTLAKKPLTSYSGQDSMNRSQSRETDLESGIGSHGHWKESTEMGRNEATMTTSVQPVPMDQYRKRTPTLLDERREDNASPAHRLRVYPSVAESLAEHARAYTNTLVPPNELSRDHIGTRGSS